MRVNLACVDTPGGQIMVIRPLTPEPGWAGVKLHTSVLALVERRAIRGLHSLGSLNGFSLWEAEWVSCPLDVKHSSPGADGV
jgi:hypothetical protein